MRRSHLLGIVLGVVLLVIFGRMPGDTRLSQAVQNTAHVPAFIALAAVTLALMRERRHRYALAFCICVALGIGIEVIQASIGRDASYEDVLTDAVGTTIGLLAMTFWLTRRRILLFVIVVGVLASAAPIGYVCAAYVQRSWQFPLLAEFRSPLGLYFFRSQTPPLAVTSDGRLRVRLPAGPWPGVALEEPAPDWSGYRSLVVELTNPDDRALRLIIRVHDRHHNQQAEDRYNLRFTLSPLQHRRLRIPLTEIRDAPHGRSMDLSQIAGIIIFADPGSAGRALYLDSIRLE